MLGSVDPRKLCICGNANRINRAEHLTRKLIIALLDEVRRSADLHGLELEQIKITPEFQSLAKRIHVCCKLRYSLRLRIAYCPMTVSIARLELPSRNGNIFSGNQIGHAKRLPLEMKQLYRTFIVTVGGEDQKNI